MKFGSGEVRKMVVDAILKKIATPTQLANITGYTVVTINNWVKIFQNEGRYGPKPNGHRPPCFSDTERAQLKAILQERPDITLQEIKDHFKKDCSLPAICQMLIKLGFRFKKNVKSQRAESGRCKKGT